MNQNIELNANVCYIDWKGEAVSMCLQLSSIEKSCSSRSSSRSSKSMHND